MLKRIWKFILINSNTLWRKPVYKKTSQLSVTPNIFWLLFGRLLLWQVARSKLWHVVSRMPRLKHRRLSSSLHLSFIYKARCGVCASTKYIKRKNKFSHYLFKLKAAREGSLFAWKNGSKGSRSQIYIYYICVCGAARLFFSAPKCTMCARRGTKAYQQGWSVSRRLSASAEHGWGFVVRSTRGARDARLYYIWVQKIILIASPQCAHACITPLFYLIRFLRH